MKKPYGSRPRALLRLALSVLLLFTLTQAIYAQDESEDAAPSQQGAETRRQRAPRRADAAALLMQLNLSPEQRARLIEIRAQSAPEGQVLARRLNQARRALDAAIYADTVDEALIEQRARQVSEAQAAVVRMRALTELKVRNVLSPEQLNIFRELRREAVLRQRMERRTLRRNGGGNNRRLPRTLFGDRLKRRTVNPSDNDTRPEAPADSPRTRRPKP